jgi:hypothetical protein
MRRVALIDWWWSGHHPTYFTHFAAALAEAGAEVVPFCPDPAHFTENLAALRLPPSVGCRILAVQRTLPPTWSGRRLPGWLRGKANATSVFSRLAGQLRAWERANSRKIDLVFFACIYDGTFEEFRFAERFFGFPWSGLYLHARSFRMPGSAIPSTGRLPCPERIFSSPNMRSVGVLDEGAVGPLGFIAGGKPVLVFPDITDRRCPPPGGASWGLSQKMLKMAAGRPVVCLVGHLMWTKGVEEFTSLALRPDMKDVFFFLGGAISWAEITPSQKAWMQQAWEQAPNIYAHLERLSEQTLNTLLCSSDVVFAAYRSFPNSSNILVKAAIFEKPVVVSDGFLMAERVRAYRMGEVVPEGDVPALAAAIKRVLAPGYRDSLAAQARWAEFSANHASSRLPGCFELILESAADAASAA